MTSPSKQKVTVGMLLFWRAIITAGIIALLWLQSTFMSKESFKAWETGHNELRDNILRNMDDRFSDIKQSLNRIETKVERISGPRRAEFSPFPINIWGFTNNIIPVMGRP